MLRQRRFVAELYFVLFLCCLTLFGRSFAVFYDIKKMHDVMCVYDEQECDHPDTISDRERFEYCYAQMVHYKNKGELEGVLFWADKALSFKHGCKKVYKQVADFCLDSQAYDQGVLFFERLIDDQKGPDLFEILAKLCFSAGEQSLGYEYCLQACERNTSDASMYAQMVARDFPDTITEGTLQWCLRAIECCPQSEKIYWNAGFILQYLNRPAEAVEYFLKALEINPEHEPSHRRLSKSYLKLGMMLKGWWHQQWRNQIVAYEDVSLEDIQGKIVALTPEAELGDMIQFVRFAQSLKEAGAKEVWLYTYEPLVQLFTCCPFLDRVLSSFYIRSKTAWFVRFLHALCMPEADIVLRIQSLPLLFKTTLDTIPASEGYLQADEQLTNTWQKKLEHDTNYKIGICWATNYMFIEHCPLTRRSVHVNTFAPIAKLDNVSIYSLQQFDGLDQLGELDDGFNIHLFDEEFDRKHGRFMDTAAVMKHMDLVLTVDTSIAHLAGALGVPVWVLLPYNNEYRWMQDRSDSPWYNSMRLFRCKEPGAWDELIHEVLEALKVSMMAS